MGGKINSNSCLAIFDVYGELFLSKKCDGTSELNNTEKRGTWELLHLHYRYCEGVWSVLCFISACSQNFSHYPLKTKKM